MSVYDRKKAGLQVIRQQSSRCAIGNPERHVRKALHRGSKQQ